MALQALQEGPVFARRQEPLTLYAGLTPGGVARGVSLTK